MRSGVTARLFALLMCFLATNALGQAGKAAGAKATLLLASDVGVASLERSLPLAGDGRFVGGVLKAVAGQAAGCFHAGREPLPVE